MSDDHSGDGHGKAGEKAEKPQPGKAEDAKKASAKPVLDSMFQMFKGMFQFDLNSLLSLADPEIRKLAESLANRLDSSLPSDSILRHEATERLVGHIKSRIETVSEEQGGMIGEAGEKVSDFLDMFTSAFYGRDPKKPDHDRKDHAGNHPPKADPGIIDLDREFLKWGQEAMAKCDPATAAALRAEIIEIANTRESLKKLIAEGLPKPEVPHDPETNTEPQIGDLVSKDIIRPISHRLRVWLKEKSMEAKRAKEEEERKIRQRQVPFGWIEDVLNTPVKIGVFGTSLILSAIAFVLINNDVGTLIRWITSTGMLITYCVIAAVIIAYIVWKWKRRSLRNSNPNNP